MANAADVASLKAERSDVIATMRAQTALWLAAGQPPDLSVDGEQYSWASWRGDRIKEIKDLTEMISQMSSPWLIRSRGKV